MTDLIERLRDKAARFHRMHWKSDYEDISEAADEIERLRRALDQLKQLNLANSTLIEEQEEEIERLRGEIIKLQFQGGTVDRQALENNVQRGKKIASLQADNELLSKLNQEYGAEIERLRTALKYNVQAVDRADAENERLRAWKDEHSRTEGGECPYCEIDRLRHEIDVQCSSEYVERILKENERLRAALRRIANNIDECDGLHMKEIARGALKHE